MLAPTLRDASDLLNKLIREERRSFHSIHPTHVADGLYNFCVTALALRDHIFATRGFNQQAKDAFYDEWNTDPARRACRDIANTLKHTTLTYVAKTKGAVQGTTDIVEVRVNDSGGLMTAGRTHPTVTVHLSDDTTIDAWQLTRAVVGFWREYFKEHGLSYTPQSEAEEFGTAEAEGEEPAVGPGDA